MGVGTSHHEVTASSRNNLALNSTSLILHVVLFYCSAPFSCTNIFYNLALIFLLQSFQFRRTLTFSMDPHEIRIIDQMSSEIECYRNQLRMVKFFRHFFPTRMNIAIFRSMRT